MWVVTAMLPGLPLQAFHDFQGLAGLVQPGPFQSECLTSAESQRQRDDEPRSVAFAQGKGQDVVDFLDLEGIDFNVFDTGRFRQRHGIASDVAALECFAERCACGPVHLMRGAGLEASGLHSGIQLFEVLGLDAVDPVGAEAGYQVLVYCSARRRRQKASGRIRKTQPTEDSRRKTQPRPCVT